MLVTLQRQARSKGDFSPDRFTGRLELQPGRLLTKALKKLRRLQRKLDRRRRANNPDCFREDRTWIKGRFSEPLLVSYMSTLSVNASSLLSRTAVYLLAGRVAVI